MRSGTARQRYARRSYLRKEQSQRIRRAIQELPEKYRTPILFLERLSYEEMTMTIIKNRLYRARLMLREALMQERKEEAL